MEPVILSIITFSPLLGAILILFLPKDDEWNIKLLATFSTLCSLLLSVYVFVSFDRNLGSGSLQFLEKVPWIPGIGISYIMGVDGINLPMILLTGIISFVSILVSFNIRERHKEYFILTLITLSGAFGVFCTQDLFFFIIFYEAATIPMYLLISIWGSDRREKRYTVKREYSAMKLTIYLQLGGGLVLLGILGAYFLAGLPQGMSRTFSLNDMINYGNLAKGVQMFLFPLMFIGFAIEAGIVPFHTWLPDGHSAAPTALSMVLAAVLLKMGGYGIIRIAVGLTPYGAHFWLSTTAVLGVIGVLYGALCALKQTDIKYMIAYSSVSHMGFVMLGISSQNTIGYSGALFQMFSHGIIAALLFATAGIIYEKTGTRSMDDMGGLAARMPFVASIFMLGGLAALGLPGMSGFVAELLVFMSLFAANMPFFGVLAIGSLVLTALYILRAVQRIFFGEPVDRPVHDGQGMELAPLIIMVLIIVVMGVYPKLLIDVMSSSSDYIAGLLHL
ncbi:MAG: NuoM family protein [Candidatus Xenobiia bacterium LiM19]